MSISLAAFAGKTIFLRVGATSAGVDGTIVDFDNFSLTGGSEPKPKPKLRPRPKPKPKPPAEPQPTAEPLAHSTDTRNQARHQ
jgi:hypothetical protein